MALSQQLFTQTSPLEMGHADRIVMQVGLFVCMEFPIVCWNVG